MAKNKDGRHPLTEHPFMRKAYDTIECSWKVLDAVSQGEDHRIMGDVNVLEPLFLAQTSELRDTMERFCDADV